VRLRPKSFDLLAQLARAGGRFHSYAELQGLIWPDVSVSRNSIAQCVSEIQRTLGAGIVETVRGRGVRLQSPVKVAAAASASDVEWEPPTVLVLPPQACGTHSLSDAVADALLEDLVDELALHWRVYDPAFVRTLSSATLDARELHESLGVDYVVSGRPARESGALSIRARVVDARSRHVIGTAHVSMEETALPLPGIGIRPGVLLGLRVAKAIGRRLRQAAKGIGPVDRIGELLCAASIPRANTLRQIRARLENPSAVYDAATVGCTSANLSYHDYWSSPADITENAWQDIDRVAQRLSDTHPRHDVILATHAFSAARSGRARWASVPPRVASDCHFPEELWVEGLACWHLKRPERAVYQLSDAHRRMPGHSFLGSLLVDLAHAQFVVGAVEDAYRSACRAAVTHPLYPRVFPCVAALATELGRFEDARLALSRCRPDASFESVAARHAPLHSPIHALYARASEDGVGVRRSRAGLETKAGERDPLKSRASSPLVDGAPRSLELRERPRPHDR